MGFLREAPADSPPKSEGQQVTIETEQHHEVLGDRWAFKAFFARDTRSAVEGGCGRRHSEIGT